MTTNALEAGLELFGDEPAHAAEPIDVHQTRALANTADLRGIEDKLLGGAVEILQGALLATELIEPEGELWLKWREEHGDGLVSRRMFSAATAAMQTGSDAPVYLKMAENVAKSIIKARSMERSAPTTLAIAFINQTNNYEYNEAEVESE